jgi:hypothetical protein
MLWGGDEHGESLLGVEVGGVCEGRGEEIDRKRSWVVTLQTKMIFTKIRYEQVTWSISDDVCEVGHEAQTAQ